MISAVAAPFLRNYYPDGVGMSASSNQSSPAKRAKIGGEFGSASDDVVPLSGNFSLSLVLLSLHETNDVSKK